MNLGVKLLVAGGELGFGSFHLSFEGSLFAGFGSEARDEGGGFGCHGRGLGQLGAELGNAALALGLAGFEGLQLGLHVGLHLLAQLFEVLLFLVAGREGRGGTIGQVVVGHVVGSQPAPQCAGLAAQKAAGSSGSGFRCVGGRAGSGRGGRSRRHGGGEVVELGGPLGQVGGGKVDFRRSQLAQAARQVGGAGQQLETGRGLVQRCLHIGAKGERRFEHYHAAHELQVGLGGRETRPQPGRQRRLLLPELFKRIVKVFAPGQRRSTQLPSAVAQRRNAQCAAARHQHQQRDAVRPHHHGIERRGPVLKHQVAQQQRIGGIVGIERSAHGGKLRGAGSIKKRSGEEKVNHTAGKGGQKQRVAARTSRPSSGRGPCLCRCAFWLFYF